MLPREERDTDPQKNHQARKLWINFSLMIVLVSIAALVVYYREPIRSFIQRSGEPTQVPIAYIAPTFIVSNSDVDAYQPLVLNTQSIPTLTAIPTTIPTTLQLTKMVPSQGQTQVTAIVRTLTSVPTVKAITIRPTSTARVNSPENGSGFVIHYVTYGENLDLLSEQYFTTAQAILDINYKMSPPVQEGKTIVIPEGIVRTQIYPQFEVKQIQEKTKVAFIVEKMGCNLALFRQYNRSLIVIREKTEYILARQWVLIPRERSQATKP